MVRWICRFQHKEAYFAKLLSFCKSTWYCHTQIVGKIWLDRWRKSEIIQTSNLRCFVLFFFFCFLLKWREAVKEVICVRKRADHLPFKRVNCFTPQNVFGDQNNGCDGDYIFFFYVTMSFTIMASSRKVFCVCMKDGLSGHSIISTPDILTKKRPKKVKMAGYWPSTLFFLRFYRPRRSPGS